MKSLEKSQVPASHPAGVWFIFWGEFAERCSYYGMRACLAMYMVEVLGLSKVNAGTYLSLFIAACYFLPLLGGYIADNILGRYKPIVGFSLPYIVGHLLLGIESIPFLFIALCLLAMGSGVIKPNISTLMGMTYDQQRPGKDDLREAGFYWLYFAINVGAAIAQFGVPAMRDTYGYGAAFMLPAALMAVAFVIFALGKPFYATEKVVRKRLTPEERAERWEVLKRVSGLFVLVMFFWAIFDQSASTWVFFAKDHMDCTVFGHTVSADAIQGFNPLFIICFLPAVRLLWTVLERRGVKVQPTRKMLIGFVLTAVCMGVMATAALLASSGAKVSVWWQIWAYLLLTIAEILISVTGLELAYSIAPQGLKSFVTAMWLAVVGVANLAINAPVTRLYGVMPPAVYFGLLALLLLVVAAAFTRVARRVEKAAQLVEETKTEPSLTTMSA